MDNQVINKPDVAMQVSNPSTSKPETGVDDGGYKDNVLER